MKCVKLFDMKRFKAYLLMSIPYFAGCIGGWLIFLQVTPDADDICKIILGLFLADIYVTVVVWAFGVIFKNSSFYDAYWSLVPWLMIAGLMLRFSLFQPASILFLAAFSIWSWRLTINWAYTCKSVKTEDWRYIKYRAENKVFIWHVINFFGINLMPTLIVFTALIPAILLVTTGGSIGFFSVLGAFIILAGTALETFSDISMHRFRRESFNNLPVSGVSANKPTTAGLTLHTGGLWKHSRHPNYLGEIAVWIGVYVSALSVQGAALWFAGAIAIILLFICISIPMAEKRQLARRPEYAEYKKHTRMMLPLPKLKK